MKVGQKIYLKPIGNAGRYNKEIKECTVSKVGKKYFEVQEIRRSRFFIDTLMHDGGDYSPNYQGYLSLKDYEDEVESKRLRGWLIDSVSRINKIPLNQLKEMESICKMYM